ncbi:cation:proton antiporter [Pseudomonadota bacterium]|nr:cation:proton antiporter [Pseudomonadota bacterium]
MDLILIWLSGSLLFGFVFKILALPTLIGFILAGYFFSLTGFADYENLLDLPSKIGVELLLFSIGLKVKPTAFLNASFIKVFVINSTLVALIYFLLLNLNVSLEVKILLCLVLTLSSTVIASKSLEDRKEINSFHGRNAILILIFQDILALILLLNTSEAVISLNAAFLFLVPISIPVFKKILKRLQGSEDLELIATIVIGLFLGGFLFEKLNLSGELGALVVGMLFSNYNSASKLGERIWAIREVLLISFFVSLGMKLNVDLNSLKLALILILLLPIKFFVLFFVLIWFKIRAYSAFLISTSLLSYSEFALIVASAWSKANIVDAKVLGMLVLAVCLSFIVSATLNKYAHQIFIRIEKFLTKFEREKHHPDEQPHTCGEAEVMIIGMGRIGSSIFKRLVKKNIKVVGFDADTHIALKQLSLGNRVTFADAEDPGFWSKLRFGKLKTIIIAVPEFRAQNWSTQQARRFGFKGRIIIPSRTKENSFILKESGADEVYDAYEAAGIGVSDMIRQE